MVSGNFNPFPSFDNWSGASTHGLLLGGRTRYFGSATLSVQLLRTGHSQSFASHPSMPGSIIFRVQPVASLLVLGISWGSTAHFSFCYYPQDPPSLVWAYHAGSFLTPVLGNFLLFLLYYGERKRLGEYGVLRRESQNRTVRSQLCAVGRWSIYPWVLWGRSMTSLV